MIVTEFYKGQGLGNQLWCYVVTRCIALSKGLDYGIMHPEKFLGSDFMNLDFGRKVIGGRGPAGGPPEILPEGILHYYKERDLYYQRYKCDVSDYDPELLQISDNTKIDGTFQCERYIQTYKNEIRQWLKIHEHSDSMDFSDENICILNIRGGEYIGNKDLLLPKKYWEDAIQNMILINKNLQFIIITDDVRYAKKLLPQYPSYHFSIAKDYSIIKNAYYLILSNSSFAFFPAWLNEKVKYLIAPKFWARHNISDGFWSCSFNIYSDWNWQDRDGKLFSFQQCNLELEDYNYRNKVHLFPSRPVPAPKGAARKKIDYILGILSAWKRKYYPKI